MRTEAGQDTLFFFKDSKKTESAKNRSNGFSPQTCIRIMKLAYHDLALTSYPIEISCLYIEEL